MNNQNPWDHLRQENAEQGLTILRERYTHDPSGSHTMELGVAYLWVEDYEAAEQHFQYAIKTHRTLGDVFYGMAGAAVWCTDNPGAAVRHWHAGLDAPYAVGGVGIRLPLLLFLASILRPNVYPRNDASRVLLKRIQDPRSKYWPGPLAKFVLGLGDEKTLANLCTGTNELDTLHRKWLVRFYQTVLAWGQGNLIPADFKSECKRPRIHRDLSGLRKETSYRCSGVRNSLSHGVKGAPIGSSNSVQAS